MMRKTVFINIIFVVFLSIIFSLSNPHFSLAYEKEINRLSASMADKIIQAGKSRVAVVDFTDLQGSVTELGRFIAEEFSVALAGAGKGFKVVDRVHLKSIIKEHKLSATGLIDPKTARRLGQIAGVEALVTGTITPFGDSVRLSIKILDTTTAEVIDANRGNIAKTKAIEELLAKGIDTGVQAAAPGSPSPEPVEPKEKRSISIQKVEANNFTFEVKECRMSGTNVTCHLLITNNDQDREIDIHGKDFSKSKIFDDFGNEYIAGQVQVANKVGTSHVENVLLVSGIPTRARLNFDKVTAKASKITLLDVGCWDRKTNKDFRVKFRSIPLSK